MQADVGPSHFGSPSSLLSAPAYYLKNKFAAAYHFSRLRRPGWKTRMVMSVARHAVH
jgi:hypothetical protein